MRRRKHQPGEYWLCQRPDSPVWYRTWYDRATGQRKRASLGTDDFEEAQIRLAEWVTGNAKLKDEQPEDVPLEQLLARYYQQHGQTIRLNLAKWSDFFAGRTVAQIDQDAQERFIVHLQARGFSAGYVQRILTSGRRTEARA